VSLEPGEAAFRARVFLAAGVGLRLFLAAVLPPGEAPDERAHLAYVRALAEERRFPVQEEAVAVGSTGYEYYQPPLWYLTAVPFHLAGRPFGEEGPLYAVRLWNVLLSAAFLSASLALVARIAPARRDLKVASASFLAFWPALASNGAAAGNDPLAALLVSLAVLPLVGIAGGESRSTRRALALALLVGLAILTKMTGFVLVPLVPLAFALRERSAAGAIRAIPILLGGFALASPWYLRNLRIYGDPFALGVGNVSWADRPPLPLAAAEVAGTTARTFWVAFGRYNEVVTPGIAPIAYGLTLALLVVGTSRLAAAWRGFEPARRRRFVLLAAGAGALLALAFAFGLRYHQPQGRFLFPFAGAFALGAAAACAPTGERGRDRLPLRIAGALVFLLGWGFAAVAAKFYPGLFPFGFGGG
jgi:4-amino-4-deoxy-L-arabinose transferase-like glycosyltransferase